MRRTEDSGIYPSNMNHDELRKYAQDSFSQDVDEECKCRFMIHLIDQKGNKVEMLYSEWLKIQDNINESEEMYEADMEWYLAHGTEANEVFRTIEQQEFDKFYGSENELTEGDFVTSSEILSRLKKKGAYIPVDRK